MNLKTKRVIIASLAVLMLAIISGFIFKSVVDRPLKIHSEENVVIKEGESFYSFLDQLKDEGKIKSPIIIKIYAKIAGLKLDIIPGKYKLNRSMSIKEIVDVLNSTTGENYVKFTIPEGFTIDDIAQKLQQESVCNSEEFIKAVKEYPLPTYVKNSSEKRYNLEGFLFPDTYTFQKGAEANEIVKTLIDRFDEVWNKVSQELGIVVHEDDIERVITSASMIEKEARVDEERAIISSVINNRINKDMTLSIDATVLYAHGYHKEKLYYKDLEIESPYNTYLYKGLPIGPISNPGVPSIIAALKPEETDYLFYVLENDNTHYFTNSDEDFLKKQEELGY